MSTCDSSNHLAKLYQQKEIRLIAYLCTLSKDFFHYGFFNGATDVMEPLHDRLDAIGWSIYTDTVLYRNGYGTICGYLESHRT